MKIKFKIGVLYLLHDALTTDKIDFLIIKFAVIFT